MAKKNKKKDKDLLKCEAAEQRDIQTTHGLITRSINMMLAQGIKDARTKDGDPNVDVNPKAIEMGMRWCTWNGQKARNAGVEETTSSIDEINKIREEQRNNVVQFDKDKVKTG